MASVRRGGKQRKAAAVTDGIVRAVAPPKIERNIVYVAHQQDKQDTKDTPDTTRIIGYKHPLHQHAQRPYKEGR